MTRVTAIAAALSLALLSGNAWGVDADAMIKGVRLAAAVQKCDLSGAIRKGKGGSAIPLTLHMQDGNIQFDLGPGERFNIGMRDKKCLLSYVADDHTPTPFPADKLTAPVKGSDVNYEDLTLRFLYWPDAEFLGMANIGGEDCYKIRLKNPAADGAFGFVLVFIHKKYGALWNIQAYDRNGDEIKEFQVKSVMQLPDDSYTLEIMEINRLAGGKIQSSSTLEFDKPKTAKPRALKK